MKTPPGFKTSRTARNMPTGRFVYSMETAHITASKDSGSNGIQAAIQIVNNELAESRVSSKLPLIHTESVDSWRSSRSLGRCVTQLDIRSNMCLRAQLLAKDICHGLPCPTVDVGPFAVVHKTPRRRSRLREETTDSGQVHRRGQGG